MGRRRRLRRDGAPRPAHGLLLVRGVALLLLVFGGGVVLVAGPAAAHHTCPPPPPPPPPADTGAPTLTAFDFQPQSEDVTSEGKTITVTGHGTDSGSGIGHADLVFETPSGGTRFVNLFPVAGDDRDIDLTGSLVIPQWVEPTGTYTVQSLELRDDAGNSTLYEPTGTWNAAWPTDLVVTSDHDTTAPTLTAFDFQPQTEDVTSEAKTITVTGHGTDDLSGVDGATVRFLTPNGFTRNAHLSPTGIDDTDTDLSGTLHIPQWVEPTGTWTVTSVTLGDGLGNSSTYTPGGPEWVGTWPTDLNVTSDEDTTGPTATDFGIQPVVDVQSSPQSVPVTAHATDDFSGVTEGWLNVQSPTGLDTAFAWLTPPARGTDVDLSGTLDIQQFVEPGTWTVTNLALQDWMGNTTFLDPGDAGWGITWPSSFTVLSDHDTTGPALTAFDFDPKATDVRSGPQTVSVSGHATDDIAGISSGWVTFKRPSGSHRSAFLSPAAGDDTDVDLSGTLNLFAHDQGGTWTVVGVSLWDDAGNFSSVAPGDAGWNATWPTELEVTSGPCTPPAAPDPPTPPSTGGGGGSTGGSGGLGGGLGDLAGGAGLLPATGSDGAGSGSAGDGSGGGDDSGGGSDAGGNDGGGGGSGAGTAAPRANEAESPDESGVGRFRPAAGGTSGGPGEGRAQVSGAVESAPERSSFGDRLLKASELSFDVGDVASNAALAGAVVLLIAFPAELFNKSVEENRETIRAWRWLAAVRGAFSGVVGFMRRISTGRVALAIFLGAAAVLYSFLDPGFPGNAETVLVDVAGLIAAMWVVTTVYEYGTGRFAGRWYGEKGSMKLSSGALVIAIACVVMSRVLDFAPGYMYGLIAGVDFGGRLSDEDEGRALGAAAGLLLAVGLVAWLLWIPIDGAAGAEGAGLLTLLADSALAVVFIAAVEGLVFGLFPLRFLDGEKVVKWSRGAWVGLYAVGMFLFFHVLLRPSSDLVGTSSSASWLLVAGLAVGFGALSVAVWAYFRYFAPPPAGAGSMDAASESEPDDEDVLDLRALPESVGELRAEPERELSGAPPTGA